MGLPTSPNEANSTTCCGPGGSRRAGHASREGDTLHKYLPGGPMGDQNQKWRAPQGDSCPLLTSATAH